MYDGLTARHTCLLQAIPRTPQPASAANRSGAGPNGAISLFKRGSAGIFRLHLLERLLK